MLLEEKVENPAGGEETVTSPEETESSTESEIIADLDYAADSGVVQPLQSVSTEVTTSAHEIQSSSKEDASDDQNKKNNEAEFQQDMQSPSKEAHEDDTAVSAKSEEKTTSHAEPESNVDPGKEEEAVKDDSKVQTKAKTRMERRKQRARKNSPQRDEGRPEQAQSQQDPQESREPGTRGGPNKAKRRRAEKWVNI